MVGIKDISSVWKNIKEIDLKPIRESATQPVRITVVGVEGSGRHTLAESLRTDPAREGVHTQTPLTMLPVEPNLAAPEAQLVILMVDATQKEFLEERALAKKWSEAGKNVLVFVNKVNLLGSNLGSEALQGWHARNVIYGAANNAKALQAEFVPAILEILPQQQLALGRQFPLFRLNIARQLINEACYSNAAYAFSTGLAEIVPVLDIPLNVTDMMVLTKSQAFLAYKLGLLLGFSTRWQDYVTEFGSVIGSGFLWRQIARQLIGLVPGWGIIPKVSVAYSGTYVVGNAILSWYLTGRKLSAQQMRELYVQAFARGKEYARKLSERIPKPKIGNRRRKKLAASPKAGELSAGEISHGTDAEMESQVKGAEEAEAGQINASADGPALEGERIDQAGGKKRKKGPLKRLGFNRRKMKKPAIQENSRMCPKCKKISAADAMYCQYCGTQFES